MELAMSMEKYKEVLTALRGGTALGLYQSQMNCLRKQMDEAYERNKIKLLVLSRTSGVDIIRPGALYFPDIDETWHERAMRKLNSAADRARMRYVKKLIGLIR